MASTIDSFRFNPTVASADGYLRTFPIFGAKNDIVIHGAEFEPDSTFSLSAAGIVFGDVILEAVTSRSLEGSFRAYAWHLPGHDVPVTVTVTSPSQGNTTPKTLTFTIAWFLYKKNLAFAIAPIANLLLDQNWILNAGTTTAGQLLLNSDLTWRANSILVKGQNLVDLASVRPEPTTTEDFRPLPATGTLSNGALTANFEAKSTSATSGFLMVKVTVTNPAGDSDWRAQRVQKRPI